MIQLHAERSPTLLDLSPQANHMLTKHDGSAGFAEYLDKMLGRGVFSTPLQSKAPDVLHQDASYAVGNDEQAQYTVDPYGDKGGVEAHSNPLADDDDERSNAAAQHETTSKRDLIAKHEAEEKQSAANSAERAQEAAHPRVASKAKTDSDETTGDAGKASEAEDSAKAAVSTTDPAEDKLKAAAAFSVAMEDKNSIDRAATEDRPNRIPRDKAAELAESAKGIKAENGLSATKEELLGKQQLAVSEDAEKGATKNMTKDAHSRDTRSAGLAQGTGVPTESLVTKGSQETGDTEVDRLAAAKSQARGGSDSTREPRDDEKASAVARQATSADRDEKAQRVAAGSVASLAGDKPDSDNRRTRSRVQTEIVVDLSKYETASESDKTGSKQFGGESRGGEQDGRNSFSARLDGFGGTDSASGRSASTGSDFASQLSRRLQGDAGAEIVRHAQMVVRGKESGEMRLVLRPDNLGSVRVRMQMEDGLITVRFLVENNGVRQALEQNLAGLQQAFKDAGLETGSLDVSVGNGGNGDAEQQGQGDTTRRDVHRLAAAVPGISEFGFPEHAVDLIA